MLACEPPCLARGTMSSDWQSLGFSTGASVCGGQKLCNMRCLAAADALVRTVKG